MFEWSTFERKCRNIKTCFYKGKKNPLLFHENRKVLIKKTKQKTPPKNKQTNKQKAKDDEKTNHKTAT